MDKKDLHLIFIDKRWSISTLAVKVQDYIIPQATHFKYFGSVVQNVGDIDEGVIIKFKLTCWNGQESVVFHEIRKYHINWREDFIGQL